MGVPQPSTQSMPAMPPMLLDRASLPPGLTLAGAPTPHLSVTAIDDGIPATIRQDQRDGYRDGMRQSLRDGGRDIRVITKLFSTAAGAAHAYGRMSHYLSSVLPDPLLRVRVRPISGVGSAATYALYDSALGKMHYTVTAMVLLAGPLVAEVQAFPDGIANGRPARDRSDVPALGRLLVALAQPRQ
jgi:hypothetical protein